jgi:hypothetical protein
MRDMAIEFHEGTIGEEGIGTSDAGDHYAGTVSYRLHVDGTVTGPYTSRVKAPVGSDRGERFEVEPPPGYDGPFNYEDFATSADHYARSLGMVGVEPGANPTDVVIRNARVDKRMPYVHHYHDEEQRCPYMPPASPG